MSCNLRRRNLLLAAAALPVATSPSRAASPGGEYHQRLAALESDLDGRLGLHAIDTGNGAVLGWREHERFPFCSTFKLMLAGAILDLDTRHPGLLNERVDYANHALVNYSPVTERHVGEGMTVSSLCAAALQYSDNTAANLLLMRVGGPAALTAYARSIGDDAFRLDRFETELNTALPGDVRDTSTPMAMARSLRRLTLGDALPRPQREQLGDWLRGNTTGGMRIRAGIPASWEAGDKTGTGDFGTANDVAVLWPLRSRRRAPLILAVYTTRKQSNARPRDDVIAAAAAIVADWARA